MDVRAASENTARKMCVLVGSCLHRPIRWLSIRYGVEHPFFPETLAERLPETPAAFDPGYRPTDRRAGARAMSIRTAQQVMCSCLCNPRGTQASVRLSRSSRIVRWLPAHIVQFTCAVCEITSILARRERVHVCRLKRPT